jgi:hypothetical protein
VDPKISEFFGIDIYIYWDDHDPPHFHALYAEQEAQIAIDDSSILRGRLSPRAMGLVVEWAEMHREELLRVWGQAERHEPLDKIEPLK